MNNMIVNPEIFQAILIDKKGQNNDPTEINNDGKKINFESSSYYQGQKLIAN